MLKTITQKIYNDKGLISVEEIEVEMLDIKDEIKLKEEELLKVYNEIQKLKNQIS